MNLRLKSDECQDFHCMDKVKGPRTRYAYVEHGLRSVVNLMTGEV